MQWIKACPEREGLSPGMLMFAVTAKRLPGMGTLNIK